MGCVGVQCMPPGNLADGRRIPPRGFDEDVARALGDHRVEPAHHAREADRFHLVADDEVFRGEFSLHSIESLERLARAREANYNAGETLKTLDGVERKLTPED